MSSLSDTQKQRRCRLILVCSDGDAVDMKTIGFILSKAAGCLNPERGSSGGESRTTRSSRVVMDGQDADGSDQDAAVADVQAALLKYINAKKGTITPTTTAGPAPVKGTKPKNVKAVTTPGPKGVSPPVTGTEGTQKPQGGAEVSTWYSVVQGRRWPRPLVVMHHVPSFDRPDEESAAAATLTRHPNPTDVVVTLQKALCTIVDEMEGKTTPTFRRHSRIRSAVARGDVGEGPKEVVKVATPTPAGRIEEHTKGLSAVCVVVPLRDPRVLSLLMEASNEPPVKRLDVRLVVNFVDATPSLSNVPLSSGASVTPPGQRQRNPMVAKRQQGRDVSAGQTLGGPREGDVNAGAVGCGTFSGVMEKCSRLGIATKISSSAAASHAHKVLFLREVVENRGEDKSSVIKRCFCSVLPIMCNVVGDVAYYSRCFLSKPAYQCPNLPFPRSQEEPTTQSLPLGESEERKRSELRDANSMVFNPGKRSYFWGDPTKYTAPLCEPSFSSKDWSQYLHERKVYGQWTCVSAAYALASQVTVSFARMQSPKFVRPVPQEELARPCNGMSVPLSSEAVGSRGELCGSPSLLPQSIHCYAEKRPVLSSVGPLPDVTEEVRQDDVTDTASDSVLKRYVTESKSKERKSAGKSQKRSPSQSPVRNTSTDHTLGSREVVDPGVMLPLDHTMDRPSVPTTQDDVRSLTREFVQKGLGVTGRQATFSPSLPLPVCGKSHSSTCAGELLEEPLNGLMLSMAETSVDLRLLERIEKLFLHTDRLSGIKFDKVREAAEVAAHQAPFVEDKLQKSVERSLTHRERTHILQGVFLEMIAASVGISDKVVNTRFPEGTLSNSQCASAVSPSLHAGVCPNARPLEENVSKRTAIRRLYEFSARFGSHLCRLVRCVVPDPLESIYGNLASFRSTGAENIRAQNRVVAVMAGGVATPIQRQSIRVWCHCFCGVPSLDQFNELLSSEAACLATTPTLPTLSNTQVEVTKTLSTTRCFGGGLGDAIRLQILRDLRNSPQVIVPQLEEVGRGGGVWRSEGGVQTVVEGRHTLYPHDNSIVEVITTDRSRICRYVKASEIVCALHYYITPPPPRRVVLPTASNAPGTAEQASGEVQDGGLPSGVSGLPTPRQAEQELMYFTTVFDDGVVFTCSNRPRHRLQFAAGTTSNGDKDGGNYNGSTPRETSSARGRAPCRKGLSPSSNRTRGGLPTVQSFRRRFSRRARGKGKGEDGGPNSGKNAQEGVNCQFPVDDGGSVLLWTALKDPRCPYEHVALPSGQRGVPAVAITISAGGVCVHNEEHEGVLWFSRHDSMLRHVPELLCCVHRLREPVLLQKSVEIEVRRALIEDSGVVCRYFHSGATQMLYPDGMIVTSYPVITVGGISSSREGRPEAVVETIFTPKGFCYAREVTLEGAGRLRAVPSGKVESCTTCDRGNHCRTVSRADGVLVVRYDRYPPRKPMKDGGTAGPNAADKSDCADCKGDGMCACTSTCCGETNVLARVVLYADGTCVTSFIGGLAHEPDDRLPPPLVPLLQDAAAVKKSCGAAVSYCVEGPSLPRVFLCAPLDRRSDSQNSSSQRLEASFGVDSGSNIVPRSNDKETSQDCDSIKGSFTSIAQSVRESTNAFGVASSAREAVSRCEPKPHDRFYMVFGDGTVLRRRVIFRGMRGVVTPFLETLFTRRSETSVRVLHESGVVVVEPSEACLRNRSSVTSMAVGEGFPVFDIALGGMRLVDGRRYITEVKRLYSSGPVSANIQEFTLEQLLRQLVLPMYTPHKVTKARWQAMRREEIEAEEEDRRSRISGKCPPLTNRLREIAEEFVITNNLLSMSLLRSTAQGGNHCGDPQNALDTKVVNSSLSAWGQPAHCDNAHKSLTEASIREHPQLVNLFDVQTSFPQDCSAPVVVAPLFFSEMQNGKVVQYLQLRDVNNFIRERNSGLKPVFLSVSTCAGEPGVQQLSFLRVNEGSKGADICAGGVNMTCGDRWTGDCNISCPLGVSRVTSEYDLTDAKTGKMGNTAVVGSKLGEAVHQQRQLALFSGGTPLYPTSRWLPVTLQPPRKFLQYTPRCIKDTGKTVIEHDTTFSCIPGGEGAAAVHDLLEAKNPERSGFGIQRLRMLFKFSDVAGVVQQLLLLEASRKQRQLSSLVLYTKAMGTSYGFSGTMTDFSNGEEERPLSEKTASFVGTASI